jgi:hypothetical protein
VDPNWIYWTQSHFTSIAPDSQQISSLLFITRKKEEIEILFKPTPVVTSEGKLEGIIGNMFDEGSTPAIIRIDGEDIGSCTTIRIFSNVPETFARRVLSSLILLWTPNGKPRIRRLLS